MKFRRSNAVMVLALVSLATAAFSQAPGANPPSAPVSNPASTPASALLPVTLSAPDSNFPLGPGDTIRIRVRNYPELSTETPVTSDGSIVVPTIDPLPVAGETISQVAQTLADRWSRYYRGPIFVTVWITHRQPESIVLYGAAARVGGLEVPRGTRIVEALVAIGGATPNGDLKVASVTHRNGRRQILDLSHPETKIGSPVDIALQPDDLIYIPARHSQFILLGEFTRPGSFEFQDGMTVLDAITSSGGVRDTADLENAELLRPGVTVKLNLRALLQGHDLSSNLKLAPGDTLMVPARAGQVNVMGAVARAGAANYQNNMTVEDAINGAGGIRDSSDLENAVLIRNGISSKVDLRALVQDHDPSANLRLQPGDTLSIPSKTPQFGVLGGVTRAGNFDYRDGTTLVDAIAAAGGLKEGADLRNATLIHNGAPTRIDLEGLIRQGNPALNLKLMPGDLVSIPERRQLAVEGEVGHAGGILYFDNMTLQDAIAAVGGVKDTADLDNAVLVRKGVSSKLDLRALLQNQAPAANIKLEPGDFISIPQQHNQFVVLGSVKNPGYYAYRNNMTVLDALNTAGGPVEGADWKGAVLKHGTQETPLDLNALFKEGDLSANKMLAPGDRIIIPENTARNYIFGAVAKPGYFVLKPGDRVLDVVNSSGGPTHDANLSQVNLIHVNRANNTAAVNKVNISDFLSKGDTRGNILVEPDDVIYIPDKKHSFGITDIFGVLSGLNFVATTLRLVTGR